MTFYFQDLGFNGRLFLTIICKSNQELVDAILKLPDRGNQIVALAEESMQESETMEDTSENWTVVSLAMAASIRLQTARAVAEEQLLRN